MLKQNYFTNKYIIDKFILMYIVMRILQVAVFYIFQMNKRKSSSFRSPDLFRYIFESRKMYQTFDSFHQNSCFSRFQTQSLL